MDDVFFWFVYNFGDANKLLQIRWVFDTPVLDAIVGFIVQAVYCWRIWVLSGWRTVSVLTFVVSLLQCVLILVPQPPLFRFPCWPVLLGSQVGLG